LKAAKNWKSKVVMASNHDAKKIHPDLAQGLKGYLFDSTSLAIASFEKILWILASRIDHRYSWQSQVRCADDECSLLPTDATFFVEVQVLLDQTQEFLYLHQAHQKGVLPFASKLL
jgi:hypothetical protein